METNKIINELKNDYRTAEEWLLFYNERERQYELDESYILDGSPAYESYGRTGQGNGWTEYKAVQLSKLDYMEKWIIVIKFIQEELLSEEKQLFLAIRRQAVYKNRKIERKGKQKVNWILFVQENYAKEMAKRKEKPESEFWLSPNTINTWWKQMVNTTRLIALKRKCIF